MLPSNYKILYTREDIQREVKKMGGEITKWCQKVWEESHTDVITIPVLRGGIFLFADLVREIECSVEICPARTWAYHVGENAAPRPDVAVSLESVPAKGRHVLIIDDICDSGRTLKTLSESLKKMGALEVRTAVLVQREIEDEIFTPDWVGMKYSGKEWFVGYGMEDAERWRNVPHLCIIQQNS